MGRRTIFPRNSARRFVSSSLKFIGKSAYRALAAMVLLLLHSTNLYSTKLRPNLPSDWLPVADRVMAIASEFSFWLAIGIALGAVLYTYYEADREIRDPKTTATLKQFYVELGSILEKKVTSDVELQSLRAAVDDKKIEIHAWVKTNMDYSSLARLVQQGPTGFQHFHFKRHDAYNDEHSSLMDTIIRMQERLLVLIETPVWI